MTPSTKRDTWLVLKTLWAVAVCGVWITWVVLLFTLDREIGWYLAAGWAGWSLSTIVHGIDRVIDKRSEC